MVYAYRYTRGGVLRGAAPRRRRQRRREQIAAVGGQAAPVRLGQPKVDVGRGDPARAAAGRRRQGGGGDGAPAVVGRAPGERTIADLGVQPAWVLEAAE